MIRPARPADAETIFRIKRAASLAAFAHVFPPDEYPYPDEDVRAGIEEWLRDPHVHVALADGGYVTWSRETLHSLFVVPEKWGSGLGAALHDHAVASLRELATVARLWTLDPNPRAQRFYERRGWRRDGRTRTAPFPPYPNEVGYSLTLR